MAGECITRLAFESFLSEVNPCDSDADDFILPLCSDSDTSSEDEPTSPSRKRKHPSSEDTEVAKDGTVWCEESLGARLNFTPIEPYAKDGEPTAEASRSISTRLQSFLSFITLDMLHIIQECTCQHAQQTGHFDPFLEVAELMAFIGVVLLRGVNKVPALTDSWSSDLGSKLIIDTMSRDRFKEIMMHLRFDDRLTRSERVETDKFAAISDVWGMFVENCVRSYNPGRHLTIDEQLLPTRTRCNFLQYMPSKPDKFGIKFWVACDVQSKYICNIMPYLGKDCCPPSGERLCEHVVTKLMEPFMDKGRAVTLSNFFTSLSLARQLLTRKTTILGMVKKTCGEIPKAATQADPIEFTTQVFSTTSGTLTAYVPKRKKIVYILSSMHKYIETENKPNRKPTTFTHYNNTKTAVDAMDKMLREFSVRKGTRRWPIAVFYNMIDMAALNAYVLYQACTGKKERRVDFLIELAKELGKSHVSAKIAKKEQLLRQRPPTPEPGKRATCQVKHHCKGNKASVRCVCCYKFTCGTCRRETPWQCKVCKEKMDAEMPVPVDLTVQERM